MRADSSVYNASKDAKEKIAHLFRPEGAKQEEVSEAGVGEIVAAAKLKDVASGDTLCAESAPIEYPRPMEFTPAISFALSPKTRADEDKVPQGLHRMMEEDPPSTCTGTSRPASSSCRAPANSTSKWWWTSSNGSTARRWS